MPEITLKRCEMAAIKILSRREYSRLELEQKLRLKGYHNTVINKVLLKLKEDGLQSDQRFAACYARSRMERGVGPVRIHHELQNRGIAAETIENIIDEHKEEWAEIAQKVRVKKFGANPPTSPIEQTKQKKFLVYRGFYKEF